MAQRRKRAEGDVLFFLFFSFILSAKLRSVSAHQEKHAYAQPN